MKKKLNCLSILFITVHICSAQKYIEIPDRYEFVREPENIAHRTKRQGFVQKPNRSYSECLTQNGQRGHCRPIMYCRMPELSNDIWSIVDQLCVIEQSSIGICCPDNYRASLGSRGFPEILTNANEESGETRIVNRPEQRGCGITTKQFPRITGGRPAEPDEWPWMAAILRHRFPHVHCGGVLITNRLVLTAAHCIQKYTKEDIFVRLGEYDFQQINETRSRDFLISNMVYHIDFDPITFENDIAVLSVERPTLFNTYIWPICIPPIGENYEGRNAIVTGWGTQFFGGPHSNLLMEVTVPVWKQDECKKVFVERVGDSVLCAGAVEGGRDSCQGDSGGPLLIQLPNRRWVIIGIVSWGVRCGEQNRPGLYTRVDKYLSWIIQNSNI